MNKPLNKRETCATVEDPAASERETTTARNFIPEHKNDVCSMVTCKPQQYLSIVETDPQQPAVSYCRPEANLSLVFGQINRYGGWAKSCMLARYDSILKVMQGFGTAQISLMHSGVWCFFVGGSRFEP